MFIRSRVYCRMHLVSGSTLTPIADRYLLNSDFQAHGRESQACSTGPGLEHVEAAGPEKSATLFPWMQRIMNTV